MERLTKRRIRGNGYVSAIGSGCGCWGKIIDRLAAYEDTGLEPGEITIGRPACVFYCNRQCNLNGDFCAEGPGCPFELDGARAMQFLLQTTQPNAPLTLDELQEMDGQPVWNETMQKWVLVDYYWEHGPRTVDAQGRWRDLDDCYYRHRPEASPQEGN